MKFENLLFCPRLCKNVIQLYVVLLRVGHTFYTKIQRECTSNIKLAVALLYFILCDSQTFPSLDFALVYVTFFITD